MNGNQAPHRAWFLAGALAWAGLGLWWCARVWQGQGALQHGLLFTLGFLPFFMAGFALTALPKWLGVAALPVSAWLGPLLLLLLGWGLHAVLGSPGLGLGLAALGWSWLLLRLALLLRVRAGKPDRRHAQGVLLGMAVLGLAMGCAALGQTALATGLGLWGGLGTVFACALQRLTPFLHAEGRRADGLLLALLLGLWLRGLAPVLGLPSWLPAIPYLLLALLLARGATFNSALAAARRTPFVGQLHHGLLWLMASFVLAALQFELAALHALTLGFMCTTMLAMVSRVTAVQQGISLVVDLPLRLMHGLLQLVSALRVATACWAQAPGWWLPAAAAGFALLAATWLLRYGPWLLRPSHRRERRPT